MCKEYNGWSNYETWCMYMWMSSEKNGIQELASKIGDPFLVSQALKEGMEDAVPSMTGVWRDLLQHSVSQINWMELAKAFLEV